MMMMLCGSRNRFVVICLVPPFAIGDGVEKKMYPFFYSSPPFCCGTKREQHRTMRGY